MRKKINYGIFKLLILSIFILGSKTFFGQWECIYCVGGNSLAFKFEKIHFKDTMNGFGICYYQASSFLGRTIDGGYVWDTINTQNHPIDFVFINDSVGILTGDEGISKTIDGGVTWILKDTSIQWANSIQFPSDSVGYATYNRINQANYTSTINIFKTIDGGENWDIIDTLNTYGWYRNFIFVTNNIGFFSSDSILYRTVDGGINWSETHFDIDYITEINFANDSVGYFITKNTLDSLTVFKTIDGGLSWNIVSVIYSENFISDLEFVNDSTGYLAGFFQVQKTIDGGKTWYYQFATNSSLTSFFDNSYKFSFIDENTAFMAGGFWATALFKTTNGGGQLPISISDQSIELKLSIYPNPATDELKIAFANYEFIESETVLIKILNINGMLVAKHNFNPHNKSIVLEIGHYTPGVYLLQFESKSLSGNRKFVVIK